MSMIPAPVAGPLVWMDMETTGLDESDIPLEAAIGITDADLNLMWSIESLLIDPATTDKQAWNYFLETPGVARDMHEKSGLIVEIIEDEPLARQAVTNKLVNFLREHGCDDQKSPLCGSSIGFDRRVLMRWMGRFESLLHYRSVDVSSYKEMFNRWYPLTVAQRPQTTPEEKPHRAYEDMLASIEELKWYRRFIIESTAGGVDSIMADYAQQFQGMP